MSAEFLGYTVEYYNRNPNNRPHLIRFPMYKAEPNANKHIGKNVRNYMRSWDGYGLAIVRECWIIDGLRYWKYDGRYCWNQSNTRILFRSVDGVPVADNEGFCDGFAR